MKFDNVYVLDTNIILNDASDIFTISQQGSNLVVLPETVIDELDAKKTGFEEINFQARAFGRMLAEAEVIKTFKIGKSKDVTIMRIKIQDETIIDIVSFKNYDLHDVEKVVLNDRKIIKVASFAKNFYKESKVVLLSLDVMCRTRAISLGVETESLNNKNREVQKQFIKELEINSSLLNSLANKDIRSIDPDYNISHYSYIFKGETGHKVLANIVNERIELIDENELRKHQIKPKNSGQLFAYQGMTDDRYNVCLIDALAGSGKTLLGVAAGMRCIDKGFFNKIIYVRNSIESLDKGEDVGYLAGNDEKFRIYNMPLYDTLEFMVTQNKNKKETSESVQARVEELQAKYQIQPVWVGEMRGRTFSNAFVIIDEAQNISKNTMQLILSRMDDTCKVIVIGSNRQIDNMYVNKYTNSLAFLLNEAEKEQPEINLFCTSLDKVVRGKITRWAERIFEKK